jgi:hypothetical protein
MNEDTRVIICCYKGDMHQLNLDVYRQHECPITILSPLDAKASFDEPDINCGFAGKRAYIGQDSLDRQHEHLKLMLTYPENFFLIHDSDSYLLDAEIPAYLYAEPDVVWSNQVEDAIPEHQDTFLEGWPHVAFQPPYFLHRKTIEAMVAVAGDPRVQASPVMPFIDYYMVQLTMVAGLRWKRFKDCLSCPITPDPHKVAAGLVSAADMQTYEMGHRIGQEGVSVRGANIVHSVKDPAVAAEFVERRRQFVAGNPDYRPREGIPPRVGGVRNGAVVRRGHLAGPYQPRQTGSKA